MSRDCIVVALENARKNRTFGGLDVVDLLDICGFVVGETKLREETIRTISLADRRRPLNYIHA